MQDLLDYIVKNLVSNPEAVEIHASEDDQGVNFNLKVAPDDMGVVIGRSGQTIRAIRKLLVVRAMAENPSLRVNVTILDETKG